MKKIPAKLSKFEEYLRSTEQLVEFKHKESVSPHCFEMYKNEGYSFGIRSELINGHNGIFP